MQCASESAGDLWAKAAELERDFAGYKRRLAERRASVVGGDNGGGGGAGDEQKSDGEGASTGRGRRYEEYVRRDERLRQEWRARMEQKEAEMKALWARLDRAAGSRSRRGGDGELPPTGRHGRDQDSVNLQQKPGSLEVKTKPTVPVTPRCSPATPTKLSRSRTIVPSSPAAPSPRLSTPDARRRPSQPHRHLPPAELPATPRKENRLPPPSTMAAVAPLTPRPRTALARSRSMVKDSRYPFGRESPRPPRFQLQPPRTSCDGVSNIKEGALSPEPSQPVGVVQSRPCFSEHAAVFAHLKKACGVATEPFQFGKSGGSGAEPASSPRVTRKDEPDCSEIGPPARSSADNKCTNDGDVHQSSESGKSGSPDITGDSDTEPSYVYIKRDGGQQSPRSSHQVSPGPGTCPQVELLSGDKKDSYIFEDTMALSEANTITGESPMADAEEASRRASSASLYSNVRSSFSQRSELDTSATNSPLRSPASCTTQPVSSSPVDNAGRPKKNPEEDDVENTGSGVAVSITVQSPKDAMAGLKRFLTFGKKNGKAGEVGTAVIERPPRSLAPTTLAGDRTTSSNDVVSDDLDNSYVSPHVRSLQNITPFSPANHEPKEAALHAKSPRVHKSFFSLPSFKSRAS